MSTPLELLKNENDAEVVKVDANEVLQRLEHQLSGLEGVTDFTGWCSFYSLRVDCVDEVSWHTSKKWYLQDTDGDCRPRQHRG